MNVPGIQLFPNSRGPGDQDLCVRRSKLRQSREQNAVDFAASDKADGRHLELRQRDQKELGIVGGFQLQEWGGGVSLSAL